MSRLARYLRDHQAARTNVWLNFLLLGCRTSNTALFIVSLAMLAYAGDLYLAPTGTAEPPSWPSGPPPPASIMFAAMGAAAALAAIAALGATSRHSIVLLNMHLGLLALLMAAQVCLAAAVATYDNSDAEPGPVIPEVDEFQEAAVVGGGGGSSAARVLLVGRASAAGSGYILITAGGGKSVRGELRDALLAYKWADAVALAVEVMTLLTSCLLHSAYMRADERAEDLEQGLVTDATAPLLTSRRREVQRHLDRHQGGGAGGADGRRTQLPPRVVRDDSWSRRMREQYGVDTSMLSYDPQAQRGAGADAPQTSPHGAPDDGAGQRGCVIS